MRSDLMLNEEKESAELGAEREPATQDPSPDVVPFDSDEAAQRKTVTGWLSRNGIFYGDDERTARYDGCTHTPCEKCCKLIERGRTICDGCLALRDIANHTTAPKQAWDGDAPLVIYNTNTYFFGEDELEWYCTEHSVSRDELLLMLCDPQYPRPVDVMDLVEDIMPEDFDEWDIPAPIREAVDQLNKAIKESGAISWTQGKYAAIFTQLPDETRCNHKRADGTDAWKGQQQGGDPADAGSYEWAAYCDLCGAEKEDD